MIYSVASLKRERERRRERGRLRVKGNEIANRKWNANQRFYWTTKQMKILLNA